MRRELKGYKVGRLLVVKDCGDLFVSCKCECGNTKEINRNSLTRVNRPTKSCGCAQVDSATKHGHAYKKEYQAWHDMHERCYNKSARCYPRYGGRGIAICDRWRRDNPEGLRNFIQDMPAHPGAGYTIDRIENSKGYGPDNCRWATKQEQSINRRNVVLRDFHGEAITTKELSRRLGVSPTTIAFHLKKNRSVQEIEMRLSGKQA